MQSVPSSIRRLRLACRSSQAEMKKQKNSLKTKVFGHRVHTEGVMQPHAS